MTKQCYYNTSKVVQQISNPSYQYTCMWLSGSPVPTEGLAKYIPVIFIAPLNTVSTDKPWLQPVLTLSHCVDQTGYFLLEAVIL